ncbi:MAG: ChaN family lipoprotein, partial [Myxococcota bacterium]
WGFDFAMYRPLMVLAVNSGLPILALNISRELRDKIKRRGIDGLGAKDRAKVPELDLEDVEHQAWFEDIMASMGGHHGSAHGGGDMSPEDKAKLDRRIYRAQVLWDETMADTAARWVKGAANRQLIIIAGGGHCHDSAIIRRVRRRGVKSVISVRPVMEDNVPGELASPINDFLFVLIPPS